MDAKHYLVSAKLNRGIEELFLNLTQLMLQKFEEQSRANENALQHRGSLKRTVRIISDDDEETDSSQNRRKCCGGPSH